MRVQRNNGTTLEMVESAYHTEFCNIDVAPGVKCVTLEPKGNMSASISFKNVYKQFPDVEKLIIGKNVYTADIPNLMFPNLKELECNSSRLKASGTTLYHVRYGGRREILDIINVFGCPDNAEIDCKCVNGINAYAFEGVDIAKFVNADDNIYIDQDAFTGSKTLYRECVNGIVYIDGILINADYDAENIQIPNGIKFVNPGIDMESIKCMTVNEVKSLLPFNETAKKLIVNSDEKTGFARISPDVLRTCECIEWNNTKYHTKNGILYSGTRLVRCPGAKEGFVDIPDFVTEIEPEAFMMCSISEVNIPDSVQVIGAKAFYKCKNLKDVHIGKGVDIIKSEAFTLCTSLKKIDIPSNVHTICDSALSHIEDVCFHEGLRTIERNAVQVSCEEITIPESVTFVGVYNFNSVKKFRFNGSRIPENLLYSVIKSAYIEAKESDFIIMNINGIEFFMPRHVNMDKLKEFQSVFEYEDIEDIDSEYLYNLYESALFMEEKQDMSVMLYKKYKRPDMKQYLRRAGKSIAMRYLNEGKTEQLIELLKLNILTPKTLETVKENNNDATITAYLLNAIDESEETNNKTFRL